MPGDSRVLSSPPLMSPVGSLPPPPPLTNSLYNVMLSNGGEQQPNHMAANNNNNSEEISTIFVVGFPDDMQEREFQNMFIFSPGFEAATLKIPSKDADDELTTNTNSGNNNSRKQIIGFAKFRTRLQALEAKDILSGRKIDAEKGSVLKAEMAKKNLHTKRGLSNEQMQQQQQQKHQQRQRHPSTSNNSQSAAYEVFHSVPPPPTAAGDLLVNSANDFAYPDMYHHPELFSPMSPPPPPPTTSTSSGFIDSVFMRPSFDGRTASMGDIYSPPPTAVSNRYPAGFYPGHRYSSKSVLEMDDTDYLSKSTPSQHMASLFNLLSPTSTSSGNGGLSSVLEEGSYPMQQPSPPLPQPSLSSTSSRINEGISTLNARLGGLSINTSTNQHHLGGLPSPPGVTSPTGCRSLFGTLGNMDQNNPPCNTLYVGNLPPNANEEELRAMFSKCIGYKRLSFRNKPNGPMCFVEFEDVACATQALRELHGNPLSNSTKGGIRLSFSKNPLGVRHNSISSAAMNFGLAPVGYRRESVSVSLDAQ